MSAATMREQIFRDLVRDGMNRALEAIAKVEDDFPGWVIIATVFDCGDRFDKGDPESLPAIGIKGEPIWDIPGLKRERMRELFPIGTTVNRMARVMREYLMSQDQHAGPSRWQQLTESSSN